MARIGEMELSSRLAEKDKAIEELKSTIARNDSMLQVAVLEERQKAALGNPGQGIGNSRLEKPVDGRTQRGRHTRKFT